MSSTVIDTLWEDGNRTKNNKVIKRKPEINLIASCNYVNRLNEARKLALVTDMKVKFLEEAPSPGKPVIMMRDTTERPEALVAGSVKLVATENYMIVTDTSKLIAVRVSTMIE
ncbi:MAG TPA: UDP-N-acetylglucosamine 2-epimerase [Prolixibacteraceae bacterium]|nr:UDP-N-acetylglucosamine 2-epimerase [Prolixibacteraceae bacterium]